MWYLLEVNYANKLLFGVLFLLAFGALHFLILPLFSSYDWIFGLSLETFLFLGGLSSLILVSAVFFAVFVALSQDIKLGIPVALFASVIPFLFGQQAVQLVLVVGYILLFTVFYLIIEGKLKTYITFSPSALLGPSIKTMATLVAVILAIGYYLSMNSLIKENGFKVPENFIPDALLEQLINQQMGGSNQFVQGDKYLAQAPQLTPQQLQLLRQNPELLKQYGVTPEMLDAYERSQQFPAQSSQPANTRRSDPEPNSNSSPEVRDEPLQVPTTSSPATGLIKQMVLDQVNTILKQYENLIPPFLAFILFSTLGFANFFLFLLINPFLYLLFKTLEKSNLIHFQKEMREVKKLVV